MFFNILYIIAGLILLIKGGDFLIKGSVSIAHRLKLSTMVIGLTIVGFGTSAPEFLVSMEAALRGSSGIALGNVVGSNIVNIGLILGITAIIAVAPTKRITLTVDMPVLVISSLLLIAAAWTGTIQSWHGILGILILVAYVWWQIQNSKKDQASEEEERPQMKLWVAILMVILSCAALSWGASLLVDGASEIARLIGQQAGINAATMERLIGLTIVAIGTSLPEFFASFTAARKGETDMAIGNVIGSNIFNILCVVGAAAAIHPISDSWGGFSFDYLWMILFTITLWIMLRTKKKLSHTEGVVLTCLYIAFLAITLYMAV